MHAAAILTNPDRVAVYRGLSRANRAVIIGAYAGWVSTHTPNEAHARTAERLRTYAWARYYGFTGKPRLPR